MALDKRNGGNGRRLFSQDTPLALISTRPCHRAREPGSHQKRLPHGHGPRSAAWLGGGDMELAGEVGCRHPVTCRRAPRGPGRPMGVRGAGPGRGPVECVYDQTLAPSPHGHNRRAERPRWMGPRPTAPASRLSFCSTGYWVRQMSPTTMGHLRSMPEGAPHLPGRLEASPALTGTQKTLPAGPRS